MGGKCGKCGNSAHGEQCLFPKSVRDTLLPDSRDWWDNIVDPHGLHLADALPKLQGLALYAEAHPNAYGRIESVAEAGGKLRVLDLTKNNVREAIAAATNPAGLFSGQLAQDY